MKKRADDWMTHLAGNSELPSDDLTFTNGSNGGLDGYTFDTPYNEGVLDHTRLPSVKGLSGLPDGIIQADADVQIGFGQDIELNDEEIGSNFDNMLSFAEGGEDISPETSKAASLVNLDWLDPTQEQDPDRLPAELRPDQPPLNSVPALEAAWGSNEPTTGISLIPAKDLEVANYEDSIKEEQKSGLPGTAKTAEDKRDAVLHAIRRSHWGHDIRSILADLRTAVGDSAFSREVAMSIKADHGLAGKVFIRAAAFPGLKNGRWVKELHKAAKTAKYVITDDQMVADKLAMKMVANVPWGSALREYTPWLHASGYRLASGNPKEILRKAFLSGPEVEAPEETNFPEYHPEVATAKEARKELDRVAAVPKTVLKTSEDQAVEKKTKEALARIAQLVKTERLSQEDGFKLRKLAGQGLNPNAILKAAAILSTGTKTAEYEGSGANIPKDAQLARLRVWSSLDKMQSNVQDSVMTRTKLVLAKAVSAGLLLPEEARKIFASGKTAQEMEDELAKRVSASSGSEYKGSVQKVALMTPGNAIPDAVAMTPIQKVAKTSGIKVAEFQGMLRWTRQKMSEGVVGKDLNDLIRTKFATTILKAGKDLIKEAREEHEGLSGHLYVDAAAYATPNGIEGCEKGGLKHRANALKAVLAMPKCASCTSKDASGFCMVYNKRLANKPPVADPKKYQRESIRLADANDSEITASLFDAGEYNLQNSDMDNVSLDNEVSNESLGDVLFGGMRVQ